MSTTSGTDAQAGGLLQGQWLVDPAQSTLGFKTRTMGLFPVKGLYHGFGGNLAVDGGGEASGHLHVDAATVSTGIRKRDQHLRSKDFFYVEVHPKMTFDLTSLTPADGGQARLVGTLHIRDRELPIDTPVTIATDDPHRIRIAGSFEVDHRLAGFEFKHLPRRVEIQANLTLETAG